MYEFDYSSQFKKDLKKVTKQGLDISLKPALWGGWLLIGYEEKLYFND